MATAKRLNSGNYRVRVYVGKDINGKPQYKSFTAPTKKEAEFAAAQYSQMNIEKCKSNVTIKQAVEQYIKSKENVLSPSTVRGYYAVWRNYPDVLLLSRLKDINQEFIQEVFNDFAKNHSPKSCRNAHGLLSSTLKIYRPDIQLNTTLPQKEKKSIYVPDKKEIKDLYELVKSSKLEIPFILATQCGLRASEIAGLTKDNINDDFVVIKQAAVLGMDRKDHIKKPKSYAGYRCVPITKELADYIKNKCLNDGRVTNMKSVNISNSWVKFRKRHNLPNDLNFHALRHHFASKLLLLGIPQKYIAEIMGHNSLDMIEKVYQHTFPSAMETYANMIRQDMLNKDV